TDAFVTKLSTDGSALAYSTFLGGSGADSGDSIAVDGGGNAYVTGQTISPNFPVTPGAFDPTYNGGIADAYVAELSADGSALAYSTFLGGGGFETGYGIAVDGSSVYVAGDTNSTDFPTTPGALKQRKRGSDSDAFVTKFAEA